MVLFVVFVLEVSSGMRAVVDDDDDDDADVEVDAVGFRIMCPDAIRCTLLGRLGLVFFCAHPRHKQQYMIHSVIRPIITSHHIAERKRQMQPSIRWSGWASIFFLSRKRNSRLFIYVRLGWHYTKLQYACWNLVSTDHVCFRWVMYACVCACFGVVSVSFSRGLS
jgi:hypothetical protein